MSGCLRYRKHLISYIHNDLPPRLRRKVATHLQTCEICYQNYIMERDSVRYFEQELSVIGTPTSSELSKIRSSVMSKVAESQINSQNHYVWHRGLVTLAIFILLMVPWSLGFGDWVGMGGSLVAAPVVVPEIDQTPEGTQVSTSQAIALNQGVPTDSTWAPTPTSTPAGAPAPLQTGTAAHNNLKF